MIVILLPDCRLILTEGVFEVVILAFGDNISPMDLRFELMILPSVALS